MPRPVILIGNGMRGGPEFLNYLRGLNIPILTTWMAADLLTEVDPSFCGRPGIYGQRAANIIQQKATHLYCFGARLDGEQVAYDYDRFAPNAEIYIHDTDVAELQKFPIRYSRTSKLNKSIVTPDPEWLSWCKNLYNQFRHELDGLYNPKNKFVDPFLFETLLSEHSKADDVFAIGSSGNAPGVFYQSYKVKEGQRISNVCTVGAMGADIPMALGASLATGKRVICVTGDGGMQMNSQELETIRRLNLPIIFFVVSNGGYNSIRVGQLARFGRVNGCGPQSGLSLTSIEALAEAYRFMYFKLDGSNIHEFHKCFTATPLLVEVMVDPEWEQLPRVKATTPVDGNLRNLRTDNMEDMSPHLDPAELQKIMEAQ